MNDQFGDGLMKGIGPGGIIETEAEIIVQTTLILILLRKKEIAVINMDQIVQGIQAANLIEVNVVVVELIMTQTQSNPLHGQY